MKKKISKVELQFVDILGRLRSIDVNFENFKKEKEFLKGIDGSSVKFAPVERSDLILKPIKETFFVLPWDSKVGAVLCEVLKPSNNSEESLETYPRFILKKILKEYEEMGISVFVSAEMEFFILKERNFFGQIFLFLPHPSRQRGPIEEKNF